FGNLLVVDVLDLSLSKANTPFVERIDAEGRLEPGAEAEEFNIEHGAVERHARTGVAAAITAKQRHCRGYFLIDADAPGIVGVARAVIQPSPKPVMAFADPERHGHIFHLGHREQAL